MRHQPTIHFLDPKGCARARHVQPRREKPEPYQSQLGVRQTREREKMCRGQAYLSCSGIIPATTQRRKLLKRASGNPPVVTDLQPGVSFRGYFGPVTEATFWGWWRRQTNPDEVVPLVEPWPAFGLSRVRTIMWLLVGVNADLPRQTKARVGARVPPVQPSLPPWKLL